MKQNVNFLPKGPWYSVDPNSILDYAPKTLDDSNEEKYEEVRTQPANNNDWEFDYLNYSDSQLENLINLDFNFDLENPFKDLDNSTDGKETAIEKCFLFEEPQINEKECLDFLTNDWNEQFLDSNYELNGLIDHDYYGTNVPITDDYEEKHSLYSPVSQVTDDSKTFEVNKPEIIEEDTILETIESKRSPRNKRKYQLEYTEIEPEPKEKPKRRRNNTSELVQYRNKIAALRYREKKREEKIKMEDILEKEQTKNDQLKMQVEELSMKIKVFKELLSNYIKKD